MAKVTMALNVPLVIEQAKYLDWMPPGQFGSQLRLKGTIGGDPDAVLYLPGKCWATGRGLMNGGVIDLMDFDQEPEKAVNIPLLKTSFVLTNKQVPGKNYGNIVVGSQGELPGLSQAAPQSTKGRNAGPLLPGEEEGYLEAVAGQGGGCGAVSVQVEGPMESVGKLYLECMKWVLDHVVPIWTAGNVPYDASALNAATATLMIQRGKR
jgi:hypothetical protein